jgi:hypothetical protein
MLILLILHFPEPKSGRSPAQARLPTHREELLREKKGECSEIAERWERVGPSKTTAKKKHGQFQSFPF